MRRFTQGFYGYAFALLVCLAIVGIFLLIAPQSREEHIPRVDYSMTLAGLRRVAPYEVRVPDPVPAGWVPNSSEVDQKGYVTWRLGFATAKRSHALLAQSDEPGEAFASRIANTDKATGTRQINGQAWQERYRPDKKQRSLVLVQPDVTLVVTGRADWDELTDLAASLKAQPKIAPTPIQSGTPG
ncbi:hypothetical protein Sme01_13860 [Sphaerisporangium melleum]|uniref:DUF4245 domain-containing protein n=1 Tax=Sphaerisporangium melleum TaxID=321316 RepID=A0A917QUF4_9ACTN|nr:DUF4245 domain-containing protein [Sphaerisporangium melleum]GGK68612.1 hypothetical protein GCM10007964_09460 [Sphaerisporangium melleum]GII68910.1 hypothetical protein Sme01_13860 [Sphaerisporangium melleum]